MTTLAMSSGSTQNGGGGNSRFMLFGMQGGMLATGYELQMMDVYASSIAADVMKLNSFWNSPVGLLPGPAMGSLPTATADRNATVPFVNVALPDDAVVHTRNSCKKYAISGAEVYHRSY